MAIKKIVKIWEDSNIVKKNINFLHQKTKTVTFPASDYIKQIVQDLIDTYQNISCAGLAANQIGYDYKIFIGMKDVKDIENEDEIEKMEASATNTNKNPYQNNYEIYINPQIDKMDNKSLNIDEEGCLSIPDLLVARERFDEIKIRYYDINGKKIKKMLSGFLSKLYQHELDHLNGKLMFDDIAKVENLYPLNPTKKEAEKYSKLFSDYRNFTNK